MNRNLHHTLLGKALGVLLGVLVVSAGLIGTAFWLKTDLDGQRARLVMLKQQESDLQFDLYIASDLIGDLSLRRPDERPDAGTLRHWRFELAELLDVGDALGELTSPSRRSAQEALAELDRVLALPELPERLDELVARLRLEVRGLAVEIPMDLAGIEQAQLVATRAYDRDADRNAVLMLAFGVTGAIVVALLAGRFFLRLARDLHLLQQRAEEIAGGSYDVPVTLRRGDEVGDLGGEINRMARALAEREAEIAISRDRRLQDEKLFALGTFAAGIAHEVANPISAIQAIALAARGNLAENASEENVAETIERLEVITEETERISRLIHELGEFTPLPPEQQEPADVNVALQSAIRLLRFDPRFNAIEVKADLGRQVPLVAAVPSQLTQVAINLLMNAADATGDGGGKILIRSRPEGDAALITIADDGHGMSPELIEKVQDPFFTTKERGRGTGLGLAVCKAIIEEHHGELEIESVPGQGTCVHVRIPKMSEASIG